jgi:hypothetical protein
VTITALEPSHRPFATRTGSARTRPRSCRRRHVRTGTGSGGPGMGGRDPRLRSQRSAIADCQSLPTMAVMVTPSGRGCKVRSCRNPCARCPAQARRAARRLHARLSMSVALGASHLRAWNTMEDDPLATCTGGTDRCPTPSVRTRPRAWKRNLPPTTSHRGRWCVVGDVRSCHCPGPRATTWVTWSSGTGSAIVRSWVPCHPHRHPRHPRHSPRLSACAHAVVALPGEDRRLRSG